MNNDNNESPWSVFWWILFLPTLVVGLPAAIQESSWAGGLLVSSALVFELLMLALPGLLQSWEAGRPQRLRARAEAGQRGELRRQQQAEREEARRQMRAEQRARLQWRAAEARSRREALAARLAAEAYHRANAAHLRDVLPEALFRAEVAATFPAGIGPEAAWQAARELIARMQPLVRQAQQRQQEQERRRRLLARQIAEIDQQVRAHQARIARLRASRLDPDAIEDEIDALNQAVEQMMERRRGLELEEEPT